MSWFLHIDMDAFFASVEEALDPSLKGKPVIIGGRNGRGVVTSASYEARKFGVHSAMPGFQAKKLCPQGIFLPNRRRTYVEFSAKVSAILDQYSPAVHKLSIDEALVHLPAPSGSSVRRSRSPTRSSGKLNKTWGCLHPAACRPTASSQSKIAATLAKPHGLIYIPASAELNFLSPLGVEMIPGVGPKTHKTMLHRGINWRAIAALNSLRFLAFIKPYIPDE